MKPKETMEVIKGICNDMKPKSLTFNTVDSTEPDNKWIFGSNYAINLDMCNIKKPPLLDPPKRKPYMSMINSIDLTKWNAGATNIKLFWTESKVQGSTINYLTYIQLSNNKFNTVYTTTRLLTGILQYIDPTYIYFSTKMQPIALTDDKFNLMGVITPYIPPNMRVT